MSKPAAPLAPAVHAHGHSHGHVQEHGHGHSHGHAHTPTTPPRLPPSLLMAGIGTRLLGVAGLLLLLWAAVAWALGEPA